MNRERLLSDLYNLILNPGTREWEREQLARTKNHLEQGAKISDEMATLVHLLGPLAIRHNLTPDLSDFYLRVTGHSLASIFIKKPTLSREEHVYQERAVFAGGCFWCMVEPFERRRGILSVLSGYTGGHIAQPTYDQVSGGYSGHVEAVAIIFDTRLISYQELLRLYWQVTDPTDATGQFQDRGDQYRPIIFVQNNQQKEAAEQSKRDLSASQKYSQPIVTEIKEAAPFWVAENYHQSFYQKQPRRYQQIKGARRQLARYLKLKERLRQVCKKF